MAISVRLTTVPASSRRSRQTGCVRTRGRARSAREAIEGSEAKEESGERLSRVMWRRTDSSSCSERATSANPKRSKAALLARRWPTEKP